MIKYRFVYGASIGPGKKIIPFQPFLGTGLGLGVKKKASNNMMCKRQERDEGTRPK